MSRKKHAFSGSKTPWVVTTLGGLGLIVGCGTLALQGVAPAFSTWSATPVGSSIGLATGTVSVQLASGSTTFSVGATGMVPGDTVQRAVTINNNGTTPLSTITMGVTDATPTALDNASTGLTVAVSECSVAWTQTTLSSGGYTYTCSGTTSAIQSTVATSTVLNSATPITVSAVGASGVCPDAACAANGTSYLMVQFTLPTSAPSTDQGLSDTLGVTISGVQRAGTSL